MLRQGLARAHTFADNTEPPRELLRHEQEAPAAGRGIWSHRYYRILSHDRTRGFIDTFQLVEGTVVDAAILRGHGFLNFGDEWRRDFAISISPRDMRSFRQSGVDPKALTGRRIRAPGWPHWRNGLIIDATHPE